MIKTLNYTHPSLALFLTRSKEGEREEVRIVNVLWNMNSSKYALTYLRENGITENLLLISVKKAVCVCACVYMYMYMYMHVSVCMYDYTP